MVFSDEQAQVQSNKVLTGTEQKIARFNLSLQKIVLNL
jgi:hypothetical protein